MLDRVGKWVSPFVDALLDLIYPRHCAGCGQPGEVFCLTCQQRLRKFEPFQCQTCGQELPEKGVYCHSCQAVRSGILVASFAMYQPPMRSALLSLKYRPDRGLAEVMSTWLAQRWRATGWRASLIIPVPLSAKRRRQRGFNQAELIASSLAERLDTPWAPALRRSRDTRTQVGLSPHQRHANVVGAFQAEVELIRDQQVLLVDDLVTTGATLEACAQALLGAERVVGLTVARA